MSLEDELVTENKEGVCPHAIRVTGDYQYCEQENCPFEQMHYARDYEIFEDGLSCMKIIYDERVGRESRWSKLKREIGLK